jgi:hypothetical protein
MSPDPGMVIDRELQGVPEQANHQETKLKNCFALPVVLPCQQLAV